MADKSGTGADRRKRFEDEALPHLDALYTMAIRLARNPDDANDLLQETVLRAYRFFHQFETGTNCRAWMLTILFNNFRNGYRKSLARAAGFDRRRSSSARSRKKACASIRPGRIPRRCSPDKGWRVRSRRHWGFAGGIPRSDSAGRRRGAQLSGGFGGSEHTYRYGKIASVTWTRHFARCVS